jgi:hypothetical protein
LRRIASQVPAAAAVAAVAVAAAAAAVAAVVVVVVVVMVVLGCCRWVVGRMMVVVGVEVEVNVVYC